VPENSANESYEAPDGPGAVLSCLVFFGGHKADLKFSSLPTFGDFQFAIHLKFPEVPPLNQRLLYMGPLQPDGDRRVELLGIDPLWEHELDPWTLDVWVENTEAHEVACITILPLEEPNIVDMVIQFTPCQTIHYVKMWYKVASGRDGVTFFLQEGGDVSGAPARFGSPWLFTDDAATLQGRGISSGSVLIADLEDLSDPSDLDD